jgi:hypothetical protein
MVAGVEVTSSMADARHAAAELVTAHGDDRGWLDAFSEALEERRSGRAVARFLTVWGMSQSAAARVFGVSRQAIGKWLASGVPTERATTIADLSAATDILVRHLTRDRIPAVVRRPAANLDGRSLLDLVAAGDARAALEACQAMFAFERAQL